MNSPKGEGPDYAMKAFYSGCLAVLMFLLSLLLLPPAYCTWLAPEHSKLCGTDAP